MSSAFLPLIASGKRIPDEMDGTFPVKWENIRKDRVSEYEMRG